MSKQVKAGEEQHIEAPLALSAAPSQGPDAASAAQPPAAWWAQALIEPARRAGQEGLVFVAASERRAEEVGRALRRLASDLDVLVLEAWDCLPYDRASPSRDVMGRRMAVLARLDAGGERPRVLVLAAEALVQRAPPTRALRTGFLRLACGEDLDRAGLEAFASRTGYLFDDRIDEPGEIAILGGVVDIYPAAALAPVRISLGDDDRILEIRRFDPLTQRTDDALESLEIGPASELILDPGVDRAPGAEHAAAEVYGKMGSVLERLPGATLVFDHLAQARAADFIDLVNEAYEGRLAIVGETERPARPEALYQSLRGLRSAIARRRRLDLDARGVCAIPRFATAQDPGRALAEHARATLTNGYRLVLTGQPHELRAVVRLAGRGRSEPAQSVDEWSEVLQAKAGAMLSFNADVDAGFRDDRLKLEVIAAADVLGGRIASRRPAGQAAAALFADPDLRVGDVVIHEDHGLGVLTALERVETDGVERDALRISYKAGADLLAPVEDFGRIWRYGAEPQAVTLDRLNTDAWARRRIELSAEIDRTAEQLVALARARAEQAGIVMQAPKSAYDRFAARFPYPETPDQAAAIEAVIEDLASGRVMNRLICGDVGFGKTEVALRAAATAALSGWQVAVVAPTTVLARQHHEVFRRRFAGAGIGVARLSRLASAKEAAEVKAGLAHGSIQVVIGTHAIAAKDVVFNRLGLLIVDEEQRFGANLKAQLRALAPQAHRLTLTATPIPRTLQLAMVGVEDVSVIATPPARRRPIRTFLTPYDPATVAAALRRERRRGGQSFVVAPRIEDLGPLAKALSELAPELSVRLAHGELPADELDEVMVGFAEGQADVLLATNIIESGLDVPHANTMLVTRADMFGLAQLHQLRGRVGRGRAQGVAYLFHAADTELPEATRARLSTLEAFDRLGSGLAISARDLEIRGAGNLLGEEQAGHLKLIGTSLYQRLLSRAVRAAKGEVEGPEPALQLNLGVPGSIPETYVPDATLRINLYARLARLSLREEVEAFAEELEDRFGAPPPELEALLLSARVQALASATGIIRVDAGPKAIALTPRPGQAAIEPGRPDLEVSGDRLVWRGAVADGQARLTQVVALLEALVRE